MNKPGPSSIRERIAYLMERLTDREVGYINRIRQVYLDVEADGDIPLVWRDAITEHLFRAVDALLEHGHERQ